MSFGIQPADQGATVKDGEEEVAVMTFRRRQITFDREIESKKLPGAAAIPDQSIEGREEGGEGRLKSARRGSFQ